MTVTRQKATGADTSAESKTPRLSDRVRRLREAVVAAPIEITSQRSHIVTEYYRSSDGEPVVLRRAKALKEVLENIPIAIWDDELIVGNLTDRRRGCLFYPEYSYRWVYRELESISTREIQPRHLPEGEKKVILEDMPYWEGSSVEEREKSLWREQFGERIENAIEGRLLSRELGYPQGRRHLDIERVLRSGLTNVIEEAQQELEATRVVSIEDLQKRHFYEAVIIACKGAIAFAERHAALALEMAAKEREPSRRQELERIARTCSHVPAHAARDFYEAVESFWFIDLIGLIETTGGGHVPGRFDQYMYPFYKKDVVEGNLTREQALELLGCLWVKFNQINRIQSFSNVETTLSNMFQNVTIGGQTREGRDATNELSYLILDVAEQVRLPQPTVTVRYFDGLSERFLLRAAEVVRLGGGIPAWLNDKYALSVLPYYGVTLEESRDWLVIGCADMAIPASTALSPGAGFYNVAKCLDLALNNGFDPRTKKQLGPATGDPTQFASYEELFQAVKGQMANAIDLAISSSNSSYSVQSELVPIPFASALTNDCLQRGKDIMHGGARYYNLRVVQGHGMVNAANALYAMKKLVYEDKSLDMKELLEALAVNFEGKEELRRELEILPKYGNDVDEVDQIVSDIYQFCIREAKKYRGPFGDPMATAFKGITLHYRFGKGTGALPDGRKGYTPTADGALSPTQGTDARGPTAVIRSASKVDIFPALSTLFNLKFHPSALKGSEGLRKLIALIKSYFDLYGYHIQFNVVSRETLLDAKKNPHLYRDLLVRVAGFTAFWLDLPSEVQDDIIARTEQEF